MLLLALAANWGYVIDVAAIDAGAVELKEEGLKGIRIEE